MSHKDIENSGEAEYWMAQAIQLARKGWYTTRPNPRVGCVLVRDGQLIGQGAHLKAGEPHAEIHALYQAGAQAQGTDAYVTLEPCSHYGRTPPCAEALIQAGVQRVFVAQQDPNPQVAGRGLQRLREAGISVSSGLLEKEAEQLNPGFMQRMRRGRPYVVAKQAMSLDGRTAMASGESQWITGSEARADVQRLRAESCAIITGVDSLLADDSRLDVRAERFTSLPGFVQPLRVVLDSRLRTPPDSALFKRPGPLLIYAREGAVQSYPERAQALQQAGAILEELPAMAANTASSGGLNLDCLLDRLGQRQCNQVLIEAGARLTGAFLQARHLDAFWLYLAPKFLGSQARGLVELPALDQLAQAPRMRIADIRAIGPDWRLQLVSY